MSLANITGGPECASAKCRVRGYFVLLNKCKTMQISPASTAMPVLTPSSVGRSDVIVDKSKNDFREAGTPLARSMNQMKFIYLVCKMCGASASNASQHDIPPCTDKSHCDLFARKASFRRCAGMFARRSIGRRAF